jgi:hypothetical protein
LELAKIHSRAVDALKSGETVTIPAHLFLSEYPHYMRENQEKSYHSNSVLVSNKQKKIVSFLPFFLHFSAI